MSLIVRYPTRATAIASKAVAITQNDQRRYHRCNGSTSIDIAHIYPQLYTPKEARLPLHGLKLYRIHPFANGCVRPQPKTESVANKKVDARRPSKILAEQCDKVRAATQEYESKREMDNQVFDGILERVRNSVHPIYPFSSMGAMAGMFAGPLKKVAVPEAIREILDDIKVPEIAKVVVGKAIASASKVTETASEIVLSPSRELAAKRKLSNADMDCAFDL